VVEPRLVGLHLHRSEAFDSSEIMDAVHADSLARSAPICSAADTSSRSDSAPSGDSTSKIGCAGDGDETITQRLTVSASVFGSSTRSRSDLVRVLARTLGFGLLLVAAVAGVGGSPAGAVKRDAFCAAYEKLQLDPTNDKVIRKQVARMVKAKPPRDIVKALGVIKAAASGDISRTGERVVEATGTLARYVSEQCYGSAGSSGPSGDSAAPTSRCPLTEDQVSSAVGTPLVLDQASCTFFPSDDAFPNVVFVRQVRFACDGSNPSELGYSEELDGLGVKTYVRRETAVGTRILVCDDAPFEITVDIVGDTAASQEAARALASQVLEGS
jgi:hypothetical protein